MAAASTERKEGPWGNLAPVPHDRVREMALDLAALRQGHLDATGAAGLPAHPAMDTLAAVSGELLDAADRTAEAP